MYFIFIFKGEHTLKDILFKRYSNVCQFLNTFFNFKEFKEYIIFLLKELKEETVYEFYIHKSLFSEQTYQDFKNDIDAKEQAKNMTKEDVKKVVDKAIGFLPGILAMKKKGGNT